MTWTHEFCRVMLLEQIYRAMGILKHIPYHK
jgi:23S rRNA pseudoU1915 N3-methylase RlmH